jgi:hypothetical protein
MAKPSTTKTNTREIPANDWIPVLAAFTRDNRGAHAVLEVLGEEIGRQVATEDRPFDGISADTKDGESSVWIAFGSTPDDHFTHGIHGVTAIRMRAASADSGAAVEIESRDGTTTLLMLSRPEDYALPPGSR